MRLKKLMMAKDPEVDQDLNDFFDNITGGGSTDTDTEEEITEEVEEEEEKEQEHPFGSDEDDDPRKSGEKEKESEENEEEEKKDEEDPNVSIIAELREQNTKLMAMMQNVTTPKKEEKKTDPEPDIFEGEVFSKLSEALELDAGGSELLASFMKKFGSSVAKTAVSDAMEQTPQVVTRHVNEANNARDMKKNFYKANPALEAVQGYVAQIANSVAVENPTFTVDQVLEESANRSYKALRIDKEAIAKKEKPGKGKKPAFANTPKARKPAPKRSKLENELNAMMGT